MKLGTTLLLSPPIRISPIIPFFPLSFLPFSLPLFFLPSLLFPFPHFIPLNSFPPFPCPFTSSLLFFSLPFPPILLSPAGGYGEGALQALLRDPRQSPGHQRLTILIPVVWWQQQIQFFLLLVLCRGWGKSLPDGGLGRICPVEPC